MLLLPPITDVRRKDILVIQSCVFGLACVLATFFLWVFILHACGNDASDVRTAWVSLLSGLMTLAGVVVTVGSSRFKALMADCDAREIQVGTLLSTIGDASPLLVEVTNRGRLVTACFGSRADSTRDSLVAAAVHCALVADGEAGLVDALVGRTREGRALSHDRFGVFRPCVPDAVRSGGFVLRIEVSPMTVDPDPFVTRVGRFAFSRVAVAATAALVA